MKTRLNFSPVPFQRRATSLLLLWALNLMLLVAMGLLIWHWQGLRDKNRSAHHQIDGLKQKQAQLAEADQQVVTQLEAVDMKTYRKQIKQFHQIQLAFQTHWGQLLDEIAKLMPEDVRIEGLRPSFGKRDGHPRETTLKLTGQARNKEAQLTFISTLQANPSFVNLVFETEHYADQGVALTFEISFTYRETAQ